MNWDLPDWLETIAPWAITLTGLGVSIFISRTYKPGERENALVDQLQEERDSAVKQLAEEREATQKLRNEARADYEANRTLHEEIRAEREEMRLERAAAARRERKIIAYTRDLYNHIVAGNPPPPPAPDPEILDWMQGID